MIAFLTLEARYVAQRTVQTPQWFSAAAIFRSFVMPAARKDSIVG
jgi:hypothetical protein